jgi:two-component system response regulator AtoC
MMLMKASEIAPRVLIVDDETLLLRTLSNALRDAGYRVLPAGSASDGEALLEGAGGVVDLMVLDVKLPDRSGLDLLQTQRERGYSGHVIVMTAFDNPDSERVCRALFVDHYLRKPFDLAKMLELVRELASGAGDRTTTEGSTSS